MARLNSQHVDAAAAADDDGFLLTSFDNIICALCQVGLHVAKNRFATR